MYVPFGLVPARLPIQALAVEPVAVEPQVKDGAPEAGEADAELSKVLRLSAKTD